jgi:zinc protease
MLKQVVPTDFPLFLIHLTKVYLSIIKSFIMFKKFSLFFGLLFFAFWSLSAQNLTDTLKPDPNVRIGKLANGLTYYIQHNSEPKNRVELRLVVNAGSICEKNDQQGLAHLLEHMCFNGTEHFKKSALVDFIEATGVKFGAHLNANTSFDQTIFMLQMPTDRQSLIDSGLLVLEDWAHHVRLTGTEIDKERGVVKEEWRLGLGAQDRMMNKYIPIILKGSRYAQRLPIGKMPVIDTAHYETLRSFYHTWYRPDLMAVIVVGDVNVDQMQQLIEKHFGKLTNPKNEQKRVIYGIPNNKKPLVAVETDKEATTNQVVVFYKHPKNPDVTVEDFKKHLENQLIGNMITARLAEISQKPQAPFMFAGAGYGGFLGRTTDAYTAFAIAKDNQIEKTLKTLLDENKRMQEYGFTPTELARAKKNLIRKYERLYADRNKQNSARLASEYISNFTEKEPIPGIAEEYKLVKELVPQIKLASVDTTASHWVTDTNMVVLITAPQKKGVKVPSEDEVMAIIRAEKDVRLKPYVDKVLRAPLVAGTITPGKIVSIQKEDTLCEKWTLSNGMEVYIKPTDFKNDQVLYKAYSTGGSSLLPDDKVIITRVLTDIIDESGLGQFSGLDLKKKLAGKAVSLSPFFGSLQQGFEGNASPKDLETLFKLQYLYFTAPRRDDEIFQKVINNQENLIKHLSANPRMVFYDTLLQTITSHSPRTIVIPTEAQIKSIRQADIYSVYKKQFQHAAGFKIFLVGNVDKQKLKPLVEKYLASVPTGENLTWKDRTPPFPKGIKKAEVHKGKAPQSQVMIVMQGKYRYTPGNNLVMNALVQALDIELREKVREEESGTYGIYVSPNLDKYPEEKYTLMTGFGCAPKNVDKLVKSVFEVMEKMQKSGPDALTLKKVKETFIRTYETQVRQNNFWLRALTDKTFLGTPIPTVKDYDREVEGLTAEKVKKAAKKYLTTRHYVLGVLKPEK